MNVKYTFYPNSVTGLNTYVFVNAANYADARDKVLKWVYMQTEAKHEIDQPETQYGVYVDEEKYRDKTDKDSV